MEASESEVIVPGPLFELVSVSMFKFHLFVLGNDRSLASHEGVELLSVFDPADHGFSIDNFLELIKTDLLDLLCVHSLLEELLHFASLLN